MSALGQLSSYERSELETCARRYWFRKRITNRQVSILTLHVNQTLHPHLLCYHSPMQLDGEQVSNTVSQIRKQMGVTQEQLAKKVNVSRQTIISIEKGNYVPSVLLALKISSFFNSKVEEVFSIEYIKD